MQQQFSSSDAIAPGLVQLYDIGFKHRLLVPAKDILYVPQQILQGRTQQPMLCQRNQFCDLGASCNFVHARVNKIRKSDPGHVNFAWKTPQKCKRYERLPAGRQIEVLYPTEYLKSYIEAGTTGALPSRTVPSEHLLKTKVIENCSQHGTHRPTMCIHFLLNRICSRGAECTFAHVIHIDADAKPHQRAPAPARLPNTQLVSTNVAVAPRSPTSAVVYESVSCPTVERQQTPSPQMPTIVETEETASNPTSHVHPAPIRYSYRHDPYAAQVIGKATPRDHSSDDDFPEKIASSSTSTADGHTRAQSSDSSCSTLSHSGNQWLSSSTSTAPRTIPCRPVPAARKRGANALIAF